MTYATSPYQARVEQSATVGPALNLVVSLIAAVFLLAVGYLYFTQPGGPGLPLKLSGFALASFFIVTAAILPPIVEAFGK
jgi:hypothetical protein